MASRLLGTLLGGASCLLALGPSVHAATPPTVVMFMIDGLQKQPAQVAASNGASNLRFFIDNGVWVNEAYCNNPFFFVQLPDGSQPWGTATPPNIMMHTGTHIAESRSMDDIFLSAARSGIKSVFAGGAGNYDVFTNATFLHFSGSASDAQVVDWGIQHLTQDGVRLIRLHPQRIRDAWSGAAASTDPSSAYQAAIRNVDSQLGRLVTQLKNMGLWDNTYFILGADHGMQPGSGSGHPANFRSSWEPFMLFYGPGIKKGATIPYAETSDIALMAAHFLQIERPRGHNASVNVNPRGPTGTFLSNIFIGQPDTIAHPQYVKQYLVARNFAPPDNWTDYRSFMLNILPKNTPTPTPSPTPTGPPTPTPTPCSGCTLVEITPAGSAVTASTNDGNLPANTVDNSLATRWSGNGDGAWIRYNLGGARVVAQVRIAVYQGSSRRNQFDLQVSDDGTSWQTILAGQQSSGTTTQEEAYSLGNVSAQYVRYVGHMSNVGTFNSVTEVSIMGLGSAPPSPTPTPTPSPTGAPTATPTPTPTTPPTATPTPAATYVEVPLTAAAVSASTNDGNLPGNTVDGSLSTRWSANGDGQWVRFDLGSPRTVGYVTVGVYQGNARRASFEVQLSDDGTAWHAVWTGQSSGTTTAEEPHDFGDETARYVRYLGHGNTVNPWNSVTEVSVFAVP
jgi:hypothetical protein